MAARLTQTSRGYTLVLLLLLAVLVPSACLLWFMSQAVQNERLAVRRKANRSLPWRSGVVQDRLQKDLPEQLSRPRDNLPPTSPAEVFAEAVTRGGFDSRVVFDETGHCFTPVVTPRRCPAVTGDTSEWILGKQLELSDPKAAAAVFQKIATNATRTGTIARALQAQGRSLARAGEREDALAVLVGNWLSPTARGAGRPREPDLAQRTINGAGTHGGKKDERFSNQLARLCAGVADYMENAIPVEAENFLMRELVPRFSE